MISLDPESSNIAIAEVLAIDIIISGLGDSMAPSLRSYDLDVSFDAATLAISSVTFGAGLGSPVLEDWNDLGGAVDLAVTSLASSAGLLADQPASFVLATLNFAAIGLGTTNLSFTQLVLGDTDGAPLVSDSVGGAVVTVTVPEPAVAQLLAVVVGMALMRARRPRRRT